VPIVEPELLADGDHKIEVCASLSKKILKRIFDLLEEYGVLLEGCILKPSFIRPGTNCNNIKSKIQD